MKVIYLWAGLHLIILYSVNISQEVNFNFYENAKYIKTITFSEKILIGNINFLDVNESVGILVTDRIAGEVYLFEESGNFINKVSPVLCYPGFNWRPIFSKFDKKGNILVINGGPWGFRFDSSGNCIGPMDISFLPPVHLDFLSNGQLVGYYNLDDGNQLKMMNSIGEKLFSFGNFPDEYKNLIYRLEGGGIVVDKHNNIYQVNVINPEIFKFNSEGQLINSFAKFPTYFRHVEKDLKQNNPVQIMHELPILLNHKTLVHGMFLYDEDILLLVFDNQKFFGLQFVNTSGEYLLNEELFIDRPVLSAKNGKIYLLNQPDLKNNFLPNPEIEVYEIMEINSK